MQKPAKTVFLAGFLFLLNRSHEKCRHILGDFCGDNIPSFQSLICEFTNRNQRMSKKQTFNVLFWVRRGRTNENVSPLYCRVTISGQRYEISTNLNVRPDAWSATAQKSVGKTPQDKEVNRAIEDIKTSVDEAVSRIRQKNYALNIENFKLMFKAQDNEYSTIATLFDYHAIIEAKNLKPVTFVGYGITRNHLLNFIRIKYHVSDMDLQAIDKIFVNEFYAYLQGFKRMDDKKRCTANGAVKHIIRFKKVMNIALENEWINRNPVAQLHTKKNKVEKGFLVEKEVKALENVLLKPNFSIVRDLFLFAVYTGAAYVDVANLTNENISVGIDKSLWLNYHRQKTEIRVAVPLLEPAENILKRYDAYNTHKRNSRLFPMPKNQVVNRYLKAIAREAGINKCVTFHMARHTFATTITLMHGIPIETVSKMLGHTNLTTTQIYAKVVDTKVMDDMAALKDMYAVKATESITNKASNQ